MAHRMFTDASGNRWNVWAVVPQWADRRTGKARRTRADDDPDFDPPAIEQRRRKNDRRQGLPDQFPRIQLKGGLIGGWLAFECAHERRRLSPIPAGWETASDADLEHMLRSATAAGNPRRLIE